MRGIALSLRSPTNLLKDAFSKMSVAYDPAAVRDMVRMIGLFPSQSTSPKRCELLRALHSRGNTTTKTPYGQWDNEDEFLNRQLGACHMALNDYHAARRHIVNTTDVAALQPLCADGGGNNPRWRCAVLLGACCSPTHVHDEAKG